MGRRAPPTGTGPEPSQRDSETLVLCLERALPRSMVSGAAEALQVFERERPDCVMSGIDMPGDDGYALMRTLRALPWDRGGRTPAIALTGWTRVEDRDRALRAGFHFFLPKPVDARVLVSVVASLTKHHTFN